ncbi:hypothetical protein AAUPMC_17896, partial [Pasteurella multocida subsp. multocida str. Anand1_cattle]
TTAAIVPLSVSAIPLFRTFNCKCIIGNSKWLNRSRKIHGSDKLANCHQIYLPESIPILINGITLTLVALIGYSAMAGAVGGGGLGNLAITYGEHRNMIYVKWIATIIIVLIVMLSQKLGDHLARTF